MKQPEMSNPFKQSGPRRKPPGTAVQPKETMMIYIMCGVLLMVLGAMAWMFNEQRKAQQQEDIEAGRSETTPGIRLHKEPGEAPPEKKETDRDKRTEPLPEIPKTEEGFQWALEKFKAQEDLRKEIDHDSIEFLSLVHYFIKTLSPEEAGKRVDPKATPLDLFEKPEESNGTFIRLKGRVITPYAEIVNRPNPTKTREVPRIFIESRTPGQPDRTFIIYLAEPPVDEKTGKPIKWNGYYKNNVEFFCTDNVEVEGVFLRLFEYEVQLPRHREQPWHRAAVLFAKNIKTFQLPPPPSYKTEFIVGTVLAALVLVAIVILAGVMSRKYEKGTVRMRMHDIRKKKKQEGEKPAGESWSELPPTPSGEMPPSSPDLPEKPSS